MRIVVIVSMLSSTAFAQAPQFSAINKLEGPRAGRVVGPPNENGLLVIDTSQSRTVRETQTKLKMMTDDEGNVQQRKVAYVTHVPVVENHVTVVSTSTARFELKGVEITADEINERLVAGTSVVVSPRKLDAKWRDVLNESVIVIWPRERAESSGPALNHLTPWRQQIGEPIGRLQGALNGGSPLKGPSAITVE